MIFRLYDGVETIRVQWKPYFEFGSFPGLAVQTSLLSGAVASALRGLRDREGRQQIRFPPLGTHTSCSVSHFQDRIHTVVQTVNTLLSERLCVRCFWPTVGSWKCPEHI